MTKKHIFIMEKHTDLLLFKIEKHSKDFYKKLQEKYSRVYELQNKWENISLEEKKEFYALSYEIDKLTQYPSLANAYFYNIGFLGEFFHLDKQICNILMPNGSFGIEIKKEDVRRLITICGTLLEMHSKQDDWMEYARTNLPTNKKYGCTEYNQQYIDDVTLVYHTFCDIYDNFEFDKYQLLLT